jgi:aminomethyltransferase
MLVARYVAMRTGPTRLWSLEVVLPGMFAGPAWTFITRKAGPNAIAPIGQAAREVLRIEAGAVRYGCEIDQTIDPVTAGLEAAVDFGKDFLGAGALAEIRSRGAQRRRIRLVLVRAEGGGSAALAPPAGCPVLGADGRPTGAITSAAFCPALGAIVAMAYVRADASGAGTPVHVTAPPTGERLAGQIS